MSAVCINASDLRLPTDVTDVLGVVRAGVGTAGMVKVVLMAGEESHGGSSGRGGGGGCGCDGGGGRGRAGVQNLVMVNGRDVGGRRGESVKKQRGR